MNQERKNLYVFGYGLALLIPALIIVRGINIPVGLGALLALLFTFIVVMVVIAKIPEIKPIFNLWILIVQALAFVQRFNQPFSWSVAILLGMSVFFLVVTIIEVERLKSLYALWMKLAHGLGLIMTLVILSLVYFTMFSISGLVLRLLKKDLLDRAWEPGRKSYWNDKKHVNEDVSRYKNQF